MSRNVPRVAAIAMIGSLIAPGLGHARIDPDCGRTGTKPIAASFAQPQNGQVVVSHQGGQVIASSGSAQPVVLSTTGQITVVIDYSCIMDMSLTVTQVAPGTQAPQTFPYSDEDLNGPQGQPCAVSQLTQLVDIGLNAGTYEFALTGNGCNGAPLTRTAQGGVVGDPPLPVPALRQLA